jgi:type IV secretion system protein VirB4
MSKGRMSTAVPWARKEALAGERLPYRSLLDGHTAVLRDGAVMCALLVPGLPFETEDSDALSAHTAARELLLRSALDARFVLCHHVIRRRVHVELEATFEDPLAAHIDARRRERLADGALFVNDQFLVLVRRPARGKAGWPERLSRRLKRRGAELAPEPQDVRALHAAAAAMIASLGAYGARLLGDYDTASGTCSEVLELLSALYNGEMRPVRRPAAGTDIGLMLPYKRISFGLDALELRGAGGSMGGGASFASLLSLKDYPDSTSPGLADGLLRLPCELVLTESYAPADRQVARERIDLAVRRLKSADEEALAERREMQAARDALGVGATGFGDHHLTVLVRSERLEALDEATAACAAALAEAGAIAVREEVNLEPAFWGQFPGNEAFVVRRALISSANMACFGSLHGFALGHAQGNHWGEAVTLLQTTSATPFFFNFHAAGTGGGDLGNFTVIGPSGSGKTVVMNFLAAQAQKFSPRTVLFDKDRGAEVFVRGIGGTYSRIAAGHPTGFNPLALLDSAANRAFLRDWLAVLLAAQGPEELATIAGAVEAAYANAPELRRLSHFRELLAGSRRPQPGDLASRLEPWLATGEHGWLFDNEHDRLDLSARTLGFDMTALLEQPKLRTPTMMYLFHRIEERLDGTPTMILIDEGWKALDDEVFAARIRDWLKTLRKRNALVGFATQSARDALDSRIATALVEQTATMLFMPNQRARAEDYCDGFGLTLHELDLIRTLPAHSRCFLVRQAQASVVVRLDLSGMPEVLAVLSGRESTVRRLDALRAQYGDAPAAWYPALTGELWPGEDDEPGLWTAAAE